MIASAPLLLSSILLFAALGAAAEGMERGGAAAEGAADWRSQGWMLPLLERAEAALERNEGIPELRAELLAVETEGAESPRLHRLLGELAVRDGDDASAARSFGRSLLLRSEQVETRAALAAALVRLSRYDEAVYEYAAAVQAAPNDDALRGRYADALESAQRYAEARGQLELLIARQPGKEAPLRQLARFLARRGDREGAAAASAKADRLRPGNRVLRPLPPSKR